MGPRPTRRRYCRCGTHLATDNTAGQCARCERASRGRLICPPEVPAEFWQTEQFQQAFAVQHMGQVARAYRTHPHHHVVYGPGGISQALLGQWIGLRQPHVSRIENGAPIRDLDTLAHWARVLRIPVSLLWFDLPGGKRPATMSASTMNVDDGWYRLDQEENTNRRDAIALTGKALAAVSHPAILEAVDRSWIGNSRRRVDKKLIVAHQETAQALAGLYRSADPRSVLSILAMYADQLLDLLDAEMRDSDRAALSAITVGVHAQAGLLACHMNWPAPAYRYLTTSRELAEVSGDRSLRARSLGALSYLFSSAPRGGQGGNPRRCLELLDEALDLASHSDPFTRGWLSTWRADQHVTLGNIHAAWADIEVADGELDSVHSGPLEGFFARPTYGYGMKGHLNSVRALVLALDGDEQQSHRTFNHVQANASNMRRRIATYGHQALAHIGRRDPEAACAALSTSIRLAVQEHYIMGFKRAIGVRHRFDADWTALPVVRDLDEQLRHPVIS